MLIACQQFIQTSSVSVATITYSFNIDEFGLVNLDREVEYFEATQINSSPINGE